MDFDFLIQSVLNGGGQAVIALLLLVIGGLIWDRHRVLKEMRDTRDLAESRLDRLIERYESTQHSVSVALVEVKAILMGNRKGRDDGDDF